jgi:hypothetical protein
MKYRIVVLVCGALMAIFASIGIAYMSNTIVSVTCLALYALFGIGAILYATKS